MNWRTIRAIAVKDLREVRQNGMAWKPMIILPIIFCVILPLLLLVLPQAAGESLAGSMNDPDVARMLAVMLPMVNAEFAGLNADQQMIVLILGFLFAPLFLILPIMTASVVGTNSFVGEKERKTIEALLYTPATDRELFVGKMLAAVALALLITWLSFIVYTIIVNLAGAPIMGRLWFPTATWYPLIFWVTPAVSVLGMLVAVLVSARMKSFMEAYQTTGVLVFPVILLVIGQVFGVITLSVEVSILVGGMIWLVDAILLLSSTRLFSRYRLFESAQL